MSVSAEGNKIILRFALSFTSHEYNVANVSHNIMLCFSPPPVSLMAPFQIKFLRQTWFLTYQVNLFRAGSIEQSKVIMSAIVSQITGFLIVCVTVCSGADRRKHLSSAPLAFVRRNHRWPVDAPHKAPVTKKQFHLTTSSWPFISYDTIMPQWKLLEKVNLEKDHPKVSGWKII